MTPKSAPNAQEDREMWLKAQENLLNGPLSLEYFVIHTIPKGQENSLHGPSMWLVENKKNTD